MREWLETDGIGGFASGTVAGVRTRRYHALLAVAAAPPIERFILVNGLDAWLDTDAGSFAITSQAYGPDVIHPDGARRAISFEADPWPRWEFRCEDGSVLEQELFMPHGASAVVVSWRLIDHPRGRFSLRVRPYLSGRDAHTLHHENPEFDFASAKNGGALTFRPYEDVPGVHALSNGSFTQQRDWYRKFVYEDDRGHGSELEEDLAAPGFFTFDIARGEAVLILAAQGRTGELSVDLDPAAVKRVRATEMRRRAKPATRLERAADDYIVTRGAGRAIVAGYPWPAERARDTFIAIRGLALATRRLDLAMEILIAWSSTISEGMLPDRFAGGGAESEYTSVDASLWFVIAIHEYFEAMNAAGTRVPAGDRAKLEGAVESILSAYADGTRHGIRADADGLLAVGAPGVALTWMDAKSEDSAITPRIGKPVEVQALWLSALRIGCETSPRWMNCFERGLAAFHARFWNDLGGFLYDVVDANHVKGSRDATFRINQVFAVGGLPFPLLAGERARRVIDEVERRLMTHFGPRSLASGEASYTARVPSGPHEHEQRRHQGNVWPWLTGAFVEGWVRVRGGGVAARSEARARFLDPLLRGLDSAGIGHLFEHADPGFPHTPRGCPFFACSLGEALRLDRIVLGGKDVSRWPGRRFELRRKPGPSIEA